MISGYRDIGPWVFLALHRPQDRQQGTRGPIAGLLPLPSALWLAVLAPDSLKYRDIAILGYVLAWRVLGAQASHHAFSWTHLDIIHLWALDNAIYVQETQLCENYALPLPRGGGD